MYENLLKGIWNSYLGKLLIKQAILVCVVTSKAFFFSLQIGKFLVLLTLYQDGGSFMTSDVKVVFLVRDWN